MGLSIVMQDLYENRVCVCVSVHSHVSLLCMCARSLCRQNVCVCHQPCCPNGTLCSLTFLITLHKGDLMNIHGDREPERESTGGGTAAPSCQSASTTVMRLIDQKTEQRVPKITELSNKKQFTLCFLYFFIPVFSPYTSPTQFFL